MRKNIVFWLAAFFMGIVLPGLIFSVAEKIYEDNHPENYSTSSEQETESKISDQNVIVSTEKEDPIWVMSEDGSVQKMEMAAYLTGVLLGEMPADFDTETLKAQAIVARTYARKRSRTGNKHPQGAVCTSASCCQAFCLPGDYLQNGGKQDTVTKFQKAVADTAGMVLTYQGELIEATYFSCSGGKTEDALAVWGTDVPYLQAVESPGEENATHFTDQIQMSAKEFASKLGITVSGAPATWFGSVTYTPGGGVDTIVICGMLFRGVEVRQKLNLYSTAFSVMPVGENVHIYTKGFGHRVGMSQYGAEAMAVTGSNYTQILAHYYPGTSLEFYLD